MHVESNRSLEIVLARCGVRLKHLSVFDYSGTAEVARVIATFGTLLESLTFSERKRAIQSTLVDTDIVTNLIRSCRGIKQLAPSKPFWLSD